MNALTKRRCSAALTRTRLPLWYWLLLALIGFALIFAFLFLVLEAFAKAGKPKHEIRRAADAAWNMKDRPPGGGGA